MMKVLVILHIFYSDQVDWFIQKLHNIHSVEWDLYVTCNGLDENARNKILDFKPDAVFVDSENIGYDIWPFVKVIKSLNISEYGFILKLHTKRFVTSRSRINGLNVSGSRWREMLVYPLIGTRDRFSELVQIFSSYPAVGMVCSAKLLTKMNFKEDHQRLDAELEKLGIRTEERAFCAGTMMAFRPEVLLPVVDSYLTAQSFRGRMKSGSGGTLAHVYERVLSLLAPATGFDVKGAGYDRAYSWHLWYRNNIQSILRWIFSINREGEDSIKNMTVFGFKIKLDDGVKSEE